MSNYHALFSAGNYHTPLAKLKEVRAELVYLKECEDDPECAAGLAFYQALEKVLIEETDHLRTDPSITEQQLLQQNEIVEARAYLFSTATAELAASGTFSVDTIQSLRRDSVMLDHLLSISIETVDGEGKIINHPLVSPSMAILLKAPIPDESLETRLARKLPVTYGLVRDVNQ